MGSSKKVTVGYRYRMGLHMGLCHEPDAMLEIRAGDRTAWGGFVTESRAININAPDLFGGDEREGGIQGTCDVMMGRDDQEPNPYLVEQQGTPQPAYRGFLGLVFRGLITSNNPYIKAWAVRVRNILRGWHGGEAWYPERAPVYLEMMNTAVVIALDRSGSMNEMTDNGQTRMENAKAALAGVFDFIEGRLSPGVRLDLHGVGWAHNASTITRNNADAGGVAAVRNFFLGMAANGNETDFHFATDSAAAFFSGLPADTRKIFIFITDGEPSRAGLPFPLPEGEAVSLCADAAAALFQTPGVQAYGFNIDLTDTRWTAYLDNTSSDGVPVLDGANPEAMTTAVARALGERIGMNPAHIVYQALTDADWGMGYPEATIDQASFKAAADGLANEGLGVCLKWNNQSTIQEFTQIVADHASLVYGQDRRTGLFRMRLLRHDYNIEDLPVFTRHDVKVVRYQRPSLADTVNEVIVQFTDGETGKEATTPPLQNLANIQGQGRVVSQTLNFPGVTTIGLANRVGMRELQARSTPLWRFSLEAKRRFATLLPGEPFVLDLLDTDIGVRLVMRPGEIDYGETGDAVVRAECVEDVFAMPVTTYAGNPGTGGTAPDTEPRQAPAMAFEVPYAELVQVLPAAELAALPPDAGYLATVAAKPAGAAFNYNLHTRMAPADYETITTGDFAPAAVLSADVGRNPETDTALPVSGMSNMARLELGQAMFLGSGADAEMVRVDAIDLAGGIITVGRGCGDTLPSAWPAGTRLWGYDEASAGDPTQYVDGETVNAKVTTRTPGGELALAMAPQMAVTMASRAGRPYPPGRFQINGEYWPEEIGGDIVVTWAHRDRKLQADTLVSSDEPGVGPEPGATYTVTIYLGDSATPLHTETGITGDTFTWEPPSAATYRVELKSVREGLDSWQTYSHQVGNGGALWSPVNLPTAPKVWYSDASPVTEVAGRISQLGDLSGGNMHAAQADAGRRPVRILEGLNGRSVVAFNGTNEILIGPSTPAGTTILRNVGEAWSIAVYRATTTNSTHRYFFNMSFPGGNATRFLPFAGVTGSVNRPGVGGRSQSSDGYSEVLSPTSVGTAWTMAMHRVRFTAKQGLVDVNGQNAVTATMANMTAAAAQDVDNTPFTFGSNYSAWGGVFFAGEFAEFIFGTTPLSPEDVDRLFGYLAHKWGLAGSLPPGHPYKEYPPFVGP